VLAAEREGDRISKISKDDEALKLVVAIGSAAAHAKSEIDLGARTLRERLHPKNAARC
jgi:hypothetical protein